MWFGWTQPSLGFPWWLNGKESACNAAACMRACYVALVVSPSLRPYGLTPARLLCLWDSPGKSTGVVFHALLQEILGTQRWNPCLLWLLHRRQILYHWATGGSPQCRRPGFNPWIRKFPWRREWLLTPVFLPEKAHGQRSLAGYCPWGCKRVGHNWATKQQ